MPISILYPNILQIKVMHIAYITDRVQAKRKINPIDAEYNDDE